MKEKKEHNATVSEQACETERRGLGRLLGGHSPINVLWGQEFSSDQKS